jgi:RecT family
MTTATAEKMTDMTAPEAPRPPVERTMALVKAESQFRMELEPHTFDALWDLSERFAKRGICGIQSPEHMVSLVMAGRDLGLTAMQSIQGLWATPDNKVGMYAAMMLSLCLQSPICEDFSEVEATNDRATVRVKRKGREAKTYTFTLEDAKTAGLVDRGKDDAAKKANNWNRFLQDMLWARVVARAARRTFPDVIRGMMTVEELRDGTDRDDELVGEVVRDEPKVHSAHRDFEAELQAHVAAYESAKNPKEAREAHEEMAKWDAPTQFKDRAEKGYNAFVAKKNREKKEAEAKKEQPAAAPSPVPPGSDPAPAGTQGSLIGG